MQSACAAGHPHSRCTDWVARIRLPPRTRARPKNPGQLRGWAGATQLGGLTTSECKFQTGLHDARRNRSYAGNLPEVSKSHGVTWIGKAGRVKRIEHFPA